MKSKAKCFHEDFSIGETIISMRKGPLTTLHLVRWAGAMENWHRIHYDLPFSQRHERLEGLLVNGTFKQQFIMEALMRVAGSTGRVQRLGFQFRAMNFVNETLHVWGRVASTEKVVDYGLINIDLGIKNEEGIESTPGTATLAFPYRGGKSLPYPFGVH